MQMRTIANIRELIEKHTGRAGMVNTRHLWADLNDLSLEPGDVEEVIHGLERTGYLWRWGTWIILSRKTVCPGCNREIVEPLTMHMHLDHPRRATEVAWVEWAD
jgi:hypothetical protein